MTKGNGLQLSCYSYLFMKSSCEQGYCELVCLHTTRENI